MQFAKEKTDGEWRIQGNDLYGAFNADLPACS
jgi:hypothetical protein